MNYQGQRCRSCNQVIDVYCLSGVCRSCWHKNRGKPAKSRGADRPTNCPHCGRFQLTTEICPNCANNTPGYLERYRSRFLNGLLQPEHRAVWEKAYGTIPPGWLVHHLNGLKGDNRLENLVAMPRGDHDTKALVNELKERLRELEGRA